MTVDLSFYSTPHKQLHRYSAKKSSEQKRLGRGVAGKVHDGALCGEPTNPHKECRRVLTRANRTETLRNPRPPHETYCRREVMRQPQSASCTGRCDGLILAHRRLGFRSDVRGSQTPATPWRAFARAFRELASCTCIKRGQ